MSFCTGRKAGLKRDELQLGFPKGARSYPTTAPPQGRALPGSASSRLPGEGALPRSPGGGAGSRKQGFPLNPKGAALRQRAPPREELPAEAESHP